LLIETALSFWEILAVTMVHFQTKTGLKPQTHTYVTFPGNRLAKTK